MKTKYKKTIFAIAIAMIGTSKITNAQKIAGGWSTSYYLCNDGTVKSFGNNDSLSLGIGTSTVSSGTPMQVTGLTGVKKIAAGYWHGLAVKADSTIWSWGGNEFGQLGDGTKVKKGTPVQVIGLTSVKAISGGQAGYHSLALRANGTVWTWGLNAEGQLGITTPTTSISTPTLVPGISGITAIAGGEYHSLALKNDSTVWAWGRNNEGQLGTTASTVFVNAPQQIVGLTKVVAIAGGRYFTVVLKSDSTVWAFGQNNYGQLGVGTNTVEAGLKQVLGLSGVTKITASAFHSVAILRDSTVRTWGRNSDGQLGNGTPGPSAPGYTILTVPNAVKMVEIKCGTNYSLFMNKNSNLFGSGRNLYGQLGTGTMTPIQNVIAPSASLCPAPIINVGVTEANKIDFLGIEIFPNPSTGQFKIKDDMVQNLSISNYEIAVYNVIGKLVLTTTKDKLNNGNVDISNQPNGIYYLNLTLDGKSYNHKLIKQ